MWNGKITEELRELYLEYMKQNQGMPPDEYDDVCYEDMTYDEFVGYIKEAIRRHCDLVEVLDEVAKEQGLI